MKNGKRYIAQASDPAQSLRLPRSLHKKITEAAEKSGRSRNSEIIKRLMDSFDQEAHEKVA